MGTLYIVSTPIGNLKDITQHAVEVLKTVQVIACEDTRRTGIFLKTVIPEFYNRNSDASRPLLVSYYEQNEIRRIPEIVTSLKNGMNVALISDAGTPTISDPGFKLVRACVQEEIPVESIPGPSSVLVALTLSGLPTDKFVFMGYLPKKEGNRTRILNNLQAGLQSINATVILFESPHRLTQTLSQLQIIFGNIEIVIARELTKIHQEVRRERISRSIDHFVKVEPKGEFVILFNLENQGIYG